jgi:hypothetical protein
MPRPGYELEEAAEQLDEADKARAGKAWTTSVPRTMTRGEWEC